MIWGQFILLSLAVAVTAITITKSQAFDWFRIWLKRRAFETGDWFERPAEWLFDLFHCPYCLSHWISFLLIACYQPRILHTDIAIFDYFIEALALTALATFWGALLIRAYYIKNEK